MPKENVSARVPPKIARMVDGYAKSYDLNRTDAMTVLLKVGAEAEPDPSRVLEQVHVKDPNRVYTLELDPRAADVVEQMTENADYTVEELFQMLLARYVSDYNPLDDE
jgi:hypothetical protein